MNVSSKTYAFPEAFFLVEFFSISHQLYTRNLNDPAWMTSNFVKVAQATLFVAISTGPKPREFRRSPDSWDFAGWKSHEKYRKTKGTSEQSINKCMNLTLMPACNKTNLVYGWHSMTCQSQVMFTPAEIWSVRSEAPFVAFVWDFWILRQQHGSFKSCMCCFVKNNDLAFL